MRQFLGPIGSQTDQIVTVGAIAVQQDDLGSRGFAVGRFLARAIYIHHENYSREDWIAGAYRSTIAASDCPAFYWPQDCREPMIRVKPR
jgi:hypothetical protein